MRRIQKIGVCLLLLFVTVACTQKKKTEFHLKGTIKGIETGQIKLVQFDDTDRTSTTIDSAELKNGSFELKGKLDNPQMMRLIFVPKNWSLSLFMENANITVEGDTTGAEHYDYSGYGGEAGAIIKTYTVKGSASHDLFLTYEGDAQKKKFDGAFAELNKKYADATVEEQEALHATSDSVRRQYKQWEENWINEFIHTNPSSAVGAYLFRNYYQFNEDMPLEKMESTLALFKEEALSSPYYVQLDADLKKRIALSPGNVAPDFTALRPDSTEFTLSSTRGKLVLIDFWASWCVPCRKAIPHWKEVYAKYHEKGLEIVSVTNDNDWKAWFRALEQEKMPWIQVADEFPVKNMPSRIGTQYMIPYLPSYVLLDTKGKIVFHNASEEDTTKEIEKRLN